MTQPMAVIAGAVEAAGSPVVGGLAFAAAGGLLGWAVAAAVGGLLRGIEVEWGDRSHPSRVPSRVARLGFVLAAIATGVGIFAWEAVMRGLDPAAVPPEGGWTTAWPRAAAHLVLFAFMAAAVWCDLEYRVIPDAITVPGAILGMLCVTAAPGVLLPVGWEQSRSYAPPLAVADVLGALGPLRATAGSAWFGPSPSPSGLVVMAACFTVWWAVCTTAMAREAWRDPRRWLLPAGIAAIAVVWIAGARDGMLLHERAAESSLLGAAVSGGIVWLIREAASRALGREAMGLGDVTLMAMVGAWCGWQHGVLTFFAAVFVGLAQGLTAWATRRENELPYGPSLCLAGGIVIVGWRGVWERVGMHFEEPLLLLAVVAGVIVLTGLSLAAWARVRG